MTHDIPIFSWATGLEEKKAASSHPRPGCETHPASNLNTIIEVIQVISVIRMKNNNNRKV